MVATLRSSSVMQAHSTEGDAAGGGWRAVVLCSANVPRTGCAGPPPLFRCAEHHSTPSSAVDIEHAKNALPCARIKHPTAQGLVRWVWRSEMNMKGLPTSR